MTSFSFIDTLYNSKAPSPLVAGLDPSISSIPKFLEVKARSDNYSLLTSLYAEALPLLQPHISAIKPNIAFFEQFGIEGLRAFQWVCSFAKDLKLLVIADIKRGDIGSTADAYANAYLRSKNSLEQSFSADAITINPFLGFDTLEPFIKACEETGKGLFVLVRTSNPGSKDLQDAKLEDGRTSSEAIADFLNKNSERLIGKCGYSALGAVIGATHPEEAKALRKRMPKTLFLIPGYGAQGGTASDAIASFNSDKLGGLINVSRGLFQIDINLSKEEWRKELLKRAINFKEDLQNTLKNYQF